MKASLITLTAFIAVGSLPVAESATPTITLTATQSRDIEGAATQTVTFTATRANVDFLTPTKTRTITATASKSRSLAGVSTSSSSVTQTHTPTVTHSRAKTGSTQTETAAQTLPTSTALPEILTPTTSVTLTQADMPATRSRSITVSLPDIAGITTTLTATTLSNCFVAGCPHGYTCQSNGECAPNMPPSATVTIAESSDCSMGCPSGHHCRNGMCVADVVTEGCQITGCPADHYCVRDGEFKGKCVIVFSPTTVPVSTTSDDNTLSTEMIIVIVCAPLVIGIFIMLAVILYKTTRLSKLSKVASLPEATKDFETPPKELDEKEVI
eukprot:TRINITY_DN2591_c0_g1_i2.p1 TRINITY_DN2591_c0_g1~~TRINITY_DN2591_c0_g1_i2.p1  ORF type:complete len:326 (+),score=29.92 TRINITY_DN2591_c0_g1_i2:50-1027(+)